MGIIRKIKKFLVTLKNNIFSSSDIFFISEPINWVIEEICKGLVKNLDLINKNKANLTYLPIFLKNKILHFASVNAFVVGGKIGKFHPSNKIVVSWYHILDNDSRISLIPIMNQVVDIVHTACQSTKEKLIASGFDRNKVVMVPEGIDLNTFISYPFAKRLAVKKRLGLPDNRILIGSFQKDGIGWGEGLEPKLEKGPDVFCDVIEKLAQNHDIHVILTGPARGYIKNRLEKAGVSYTHRYLKNYIDIVDYYNVLDLYLITSRVEGGPQAILESWACGVPLISTKVGMAPDIVRNGENGFLINVNDVAGLANLAEELIKNKFIKEKVVSNGLKDVKKHDWKIIARQYFDLIYKKLI